MTSETIYKANEIQSFLRNVAQMPNASQQWGISMKGEVTQSQVIRWFQSYFPYGSAYGMFREMQAHCVGFLPIVENKIS